MFSVGFAQVCIPDAGVRRKTIAMFASFCPMAVLFALYVSLVLLPCFSQVTNECDVGLVFASSCAVGLQVCTRAQYVNVVWVLAGAPMGS